MYLRPHCSDIPAGHTVLSVPVTVHDMACTIFVPFPSESSWRSYSMMLWGETSQIRLQPRLFRVVLLDLLAPRGTSPCALLSGARRCSKAARPEPSAWATQAVPILRSCGRICMCFCSDPRHTAYSLLEICRQCRWPRSRKSGRPHQQTNYRQWTRVRVPVDLANGVNI